MKIKSFLIASLAAFSLTAGAQSLSPSTKWHWDKGTIVVDTPERPAGQENVLGLKAPKLQTVRVGFVGLGMRGPWAVMRFCHIPGVEIVALCDYEEARAEKSQEYLRKQGLKPADIYSGAKGYEELCKRKDIDLVYIAADWNHHFPVAKMAMENGKHTAIEVPSAMNLEQCWSLIDLSEKTRQHCFILENCCYDYYEMNALAMAQAGVFGNIIRAEGAYIHCLEDFWNAYWQDPNDNDKDNLHWRMKYNMENRGDVYPTHGLGPVAQCLNIHRGDRFTTLVAMDTESFVGKDWVSKKSGKECKEFRNGDHTTTLMRTAKGKVVEIQHNVMTPQPYNRLFKLTGTKGYATKYPTEEFALSGEALKGTGAPQMDNLSAHGFLNKEQKEALVKKYYHPILKSMVSWAVRWVTAVWTSSWILDWFTVCRTVCHWIWTFTTWLSGAHWQSWEPSQWTTTVHPLPSQTSPVVSGTRCRVTSTSMLLLRTRLLPRQLLQLTPRLRRQQQPSIICGSSTTP